MSLTRPIGMHLMKAAAAKVANINGSNTMYAIGHVKLMSFLPDCTTVVPFYSVQQHIFLAYPQHHAKSCKCNKRLLLDTSIVVKICHSADLVFAFGVNLYHSETSIFCSR